MENSIFEEIIDDGSLDLEQRVMFAKTLTYDGINIHIYVDNKGKVDIKVDSVEPLVPSQSLTMFIIGEIEEEMLLKDESGNNIVYVIERVMNNIHN